MKRLPWSLALLAATVVSAFAAGGGSTLHVGEKGATAESIAKALGDLGKVTAKLPNGYFCVVLKQDVEFGKAKAALQKAGIDYIFDASADRVDPTDLKSVKQHIAYLKARQSIQDSHSISFDGQKKKAGVGFYAALEYYLAARVGADGTIDKDAINRAIQQREALPPAPDPSWRGDTGAQAPTTGWTHVGPVGLDIPYTTYYGTPPLSGRKQGIAVAPSNANVIYVASAGGGIWKTSDAGVNWTPLSDSWAFLHTNSVAVHPTNPSIVYAGTGDYVGFFAKQTMGVMKSSDGGVSWTQLGTAGMRGGVITKIIVEPTNPNIICVGVGKNDDMAKNGIYRSADGGLTWTQTAFNANIDDLERGPTGKYWLAATTGSSPGSIARSANFGTTWTVVAHPSGALNHACMDIAPSKINANTCFALTEKDEQIWRTTTDGASWTSIKGGTFPNGYTGNTNYNWSQKSYDYYIGTTKQGAADVVFVGLITIAQWTSTTGTWVDIARSWQQTAPNFEHSDQHIYANHPTSDGTVFFGGDGGIFKYTYSANPVAANWTSLNAKLRDHQAYQIAVHPTDPLYLMAGLQDNASPASRGNLAAWKNLLAGDGGWPVFDKMVPGVHYSSWQFGSIARYPTATSTSPVVITPPSWNTLFIAPYIIGGNGSQLYGGGDRVKRWNGNLATPTAWTDVSPVFGGRVSTMTASPANLNAMYIGTTSGEIWRTVNAWTNENQVDDANIDRTVGGLAVNPANANDVLCGLQGPSNGRPRLWRCTNTSVAAPVWVNASGTGGSPLPDTPINAVIFDPYDSTRWYVGTDIGAFMTTNSGASWSNMNTLGLPNVHVNALRTNAGNSLLYAGTYGRGIWKIGLGQPPAFSITGRVFQLGGVNGLANATVPLYKQKELSLPITVNVNTPIPDGNATGVTANVTTTLTTPLNGIVVYVNCTHPYRGDLEIDLVAPDGRVARLQNTSNDSGDNIAKYYDATPTFRGYKPNGTWKVIVRDLYTPDPGTFVKTVVYFKYNAYSLITTKTTDANGNYSFTALDAGKYYWYPQFTGKTFTPGSKVLYLGPSLTNQNFTANQ